MMNIPGRPTQLAKAADPEPTNLWLALTALPRPHKLIPLPRNLPGTNEPVGEVAMWPLKQDELMNANAEADRYTKKLLQDPQRKDEANLGYHHTFANESALQILFRACRVPEDVTRSAFPSPGLMRKEFTTEEIGVLFAQYLTVQLELGPIVAYMTPEEMEAMILRITADATHFPFDSLSWEQQKIQVTSMASRLVTCWMDIRSAGLPLDVSTYALDRIDELLAAKAQESATSPEPTPDTEPVAEAPPVAP